MITLVFDVCLPEDSQICRDQSPPIIATISTTTCSMPAQICVAQRSQTRKKWRIDRWKY